MEQVVNLEMIKEFKHDLKKRFNNDTLGHMFYHLFDLFTDEELNQVLTYYMGRYKENKEDWFYEFHKSIRQTDFFTSLTVIRTGNALTSEQEEQRKALKKKLGASLPNYQAVTPELIEYKRLNNLANKKEVVSYGGLFDSLLWNLIHLDEKNELKSIFERIFKIYAE